MNSCDPPDRNRNPALQALSGQSLARMIFRAELPEEQVRALPAQSLYMAVKQNGLLSSAEIVGIASVEQTRLMLDLDLWQADTFYEENFWEWLSLPDAEHDNNLALLQKLLKCLDLKLLGLILARYVRVQIHEEATDAAPGPGYHTPDRGHTWLHIDTADAHKHFLLGRFLALIFETSAQIFYQLISVPGIETQSSLEELAFQERAKRLAAEGIPDREFAFSINTPLPEKQILQDLVRIAPPPPVEDLEIIEPLLYQAGQLQPFSSLLLESGSPDETRSELTLIANAAIVHFHVDYFEAARVSDLMARVRGAINIGLESLLRKQALPLKEIYRALGLQKLYRLGLRLLYETRTMSRNISLRMSKELETDHILAAILQAAGENFPCIPAFFRDDGSIEEQSGLTPGGTKPIETLRELEALIAFLTNKL